MGVYCLCMEEEEGNMVSQEILKSNSSCHIFQHLLIKKSFQLDYL